MKIKSQLSWLTSLAIGVLGFLICLPLSTLNIKNIQWLLHNDSATRVLGWIYFYKDNWQIPLANNPNYGNLTSSTLAYSDSIPLVAIITKIFFYKSIENIQFIGIWLLICFILQALCADALFRYFKITFFARIPGVFILTFTPILMYRIYDHQSLVGHFCILLAFLLYYKQEIQFAYVKWNLLLIISLGIHFYIFCMVALIEFVTIVKFLRTKNSKNISGLVTEISKIFLPQLSLLGIFGYQFGYKINAASAQGFGFFKSNLMSLFNPDGWSETVTTFEIGPGESEGYAFLGIGIILLLLLAITVKNYRRQFLKQLNQYQELKYAVVFAIVVAVTTNIGIGKQEVRLLTHIPGESWFGVLRSSGRFIWVLVYFLLINIYVLFAKMKDRYIILLLPLLVFIQINDSKPRIDGMKNTMLSFKNIEKSPEIVELSMIISNRSALVKYPISNNDQDWMVFTLASLSEKLASPSVYLARTNSKEIANKNAALERKILNADFSKNTILFIDVNNDFFKTNKNLFALQTRGFYSHYIYIKY